MFPGAVRLAKLSFYYSLVKGLILSPRQTGASLSHSLCGSDGVKLSSRGKNSLKTVQTAGKITCFVFGGAKNLRCLLVSFIWRSESTTVSLIYINMISASRAGAVL